MKKKIIQLDIQPDSVNTMQLTSMYQKGLQGNQQKC